MFLGDIGPKKLDFFAEEKILNFLFIFFVNIFIENKQ